MTFFCFYSYTSQPVGMSLMLPSGFAWSQVPPARVPLPEVLIGVRGARKWVDLMTTNEPSIYLYSEAVVRMVAEEGFTGIEFFPVEVGKVESPHLRAKQPWPRYYVGRLTGRIAAEVFFEGQPLPFDEQGGLYQMVQPGCPKDYYLQAETK